MFFLIIVQENQFDPNSTIYYAPTSSMLPFSIIDLKEPPKDIFSKEVKILTDGDKILNITRQWSNLQIKYSIYVDVPWDSPIHTILYAGSACYLIVPAEEKYHRDFIKLASSENPEDRLRAARELYKFPGQDSEQILRKSLEDKSETMYYSSADRIQKIEFSVRKAAFESLKILGVDVPEMPFERDPTDEERNSQFEKYWSDNFNRALSEDWKVISVNKGESIKNDYPVLVVCSNNSSSCRLILLPKEWGQKEFQNAEYLGNDEKTSNNARTFFLEGTLSENVRLKLIKYFDLEKNPQ